MWGEVFALLGGVSGLAVILNWLVLCGIIFIQNNISASRESSG